MELGAPPAWPGARARGPGGLGVAGEGKGAHTSLHAPSGTHFSATDRLKRHWGRALHPGREPLLETLCLRSAAPPDGARPSPVPLGCSLRGPGSERRARGCVGAPVWEVTSGCPGLTCPPGLGSALGSCRRAPAEALARVPLRWAASASRLLSSRRRAPPRPARCRGRTPAGRASFPAAAAPGGRGTSLAAPSTSP